MELTRDDERARRICSLALEFMNARAPLTSSEVARAFYPGLEGDSFRRAFSRDRKTLATCGVIVVEQARSGEESSWAVDAERSFAQGAELEPLEAAALDVACQPLLESPGFPFRDDLRLALAKLTRAFAEASVVCAPAQAEGRALATLRSCLVDGCAARVTYTDAHGTTSERTIAPYGLFDLRGERYLVAGRLDEKNEVVEGGERTYRVERFSSAAALPNLPVRVPADFSIADWRRLPFQLGPRRHEVSFRVPPERERDLARAAAPHGTYARADGTLTWSTWAADLGDAASWAVAMGIEPVAPEALVCAWRSVLEGAVRHGR